MDKIGRGASFLSLLVEISALLYEVRDVCDMNTDFKNVLRDLLDRKRVIEILNVSPSVASSRTSLTSVFAAEK